MQFKERYLKENGKEATLEIISKELGVGVEDISFSLDAIQDPISLQEPVYNDGAENIYIMDQVKDSKNTDESWTEKMTIMQIMKKLNDKEKMRQVLSIIENRQEAEYYGGGAYVMYLLFKYQNSEIKIDMTGPRSRYIIINDKTYEIQSEEIYKIFGYQE